MGLSYWHKGEYAGADGRIVDRAIGADTAAN